MNFKKIATYLVIGAAVLGFSGCKESLLDIPDGNSINDSTFWKTPEDANAGLVAVYNMFYRQGTWTRNLFTQLNGMADDGVSYAGWAELAEYSKFKFTNYSFWEFNGKAYKEHLVAINRANQVLDRIDGIEFDDDADKADVKAQALFLRAFYYYYMGAIWENCPVCLHAASADDQPLQTYLAGVMEIVENDLEAALVDLPTTREAKDYGRPTRGSAYGLLAKALMLHYGYLLRSEAAGQYNGGKTAEECLNRAKECLAWFVEGEGKSLYSLCENYADNFNEATENNAESVYEIQFSMIKGTIGYDGTDNFESPDAQLGTQIEMNQAPPGIGWNNIEACEWLVPAYRAERTVDGNVDERLWTTLFYNGQADDFPDKDQQIYKEPGWKEGCGTRCFIRKYSTDTHKAETYYWNGNNIRIIRYADILLLYAEVLNELQGPNNKSIELIDQVRERSKLPKLADSKTYNLTQIKSSKEALLKQIKLERALELSLECIRWIDLKRWGIEDQATLNELLSRDADFKNFTIGRSIRVPIPQSDCDNNPNMKQNPGY